ncbi:MAG: hypothetical protein LUG60_10095 [Erysipelotrichaceae bacterium]|nr:hypothetical protein [Erysipelotrichaceae bacterium]
MQDTILDMLAVIMVVVTLWFTYSIANIIVTIFNARRKDKDLKFCLSRNGYIFYIILTILYLACFIGGIGCSIYGIMHGYSGWYRNGMNVAALMSLIYAYMLSSIVLLGKKHMMVGRMLIDYRKLKKVNFTFDNKMSFVYMQKDFNFSTRFADKTKLRKVIFK